MRSKPTTFAAGKTSKKFRRRSAESAKVFREAENGFAALLATELAFAFVGALLVILGAATAGLAINFTQATSIINPIFSAAGLVGIGLVLFAFGTRGFRRQVVIDPERSSISFGKINSSGVCRVATTLPLDQIISIFVQKPETVSSDAHLVLKTHGGREHYTLLAGPEDALREAHKDICKVVKSSYGPNKIWDASVFHFDQQTAA